MPEQRLREVLDELHAELERAEGLDEATREQLLAARREIEEKLGEAPDDREPAHGARSRMGEAIERFEKEHPDAVAVLQRVLQALSDVGI